MTACSEVICCLVLTAISSVSVLPKLISAETHVREELAKSIPLLLAPLGDNVSHNMLTKILSGKA